MLIEPRVDPEVGSATELSGVDALTHEGHGSGETYAAARRAASRSKCSRSSASLPSTGLGMLCERVSRGGS
jgi:hypothetical protein